MMDVRFPLSLRNVEDLRFERGIDLGHETIRFWWNRFGPMFAREVRQRRVRFRRGFRHWRWHLDEVFVKINGQTHYHWCAVNHEGEIIQSHVTEKRDKSAARTFMKKALKRHGEAETIVTDGLKSYPRRDARIGKSRSSRDRARAERRTPSPGCIVERRGRTRRPAPATRVRDAEDWLSGKYPDHPTPALI